MDYFPRHDRCKQHSSDRIDRCGCDNHSDTGSGALALRVKQKARSRLKVRTKLVRLIQVAIESHDRCLISQLQAEREFLLIPN